MRAGLKKMWWRDLVHCGVKDVDLCQIATDIYETQLYIKSACLVRSPEFFNRSCACKALVHVGRFLSQTSQSRTYDHKNFKILANRWSSWSNADAALTVVWKRGVWHKPISKHSAVFHQTRISSVTNTFDKILENFFFSVNKSVRHEAVEYRKSATKNVHRKRTPRLRYLLKCYTWWDWRAHYTVQKPEDLWSLGYDTGVIRRDLSHLNCPGQTSDQFVSNGQPCPRSTTTT